MDAFAACAAGYSDAFATQQFFRLNHVLAVTLAEAPHAWGHFYVTGAPFRAYLFRVGRRTSFWIVDSVDVTRKAVNVLRLWNSGRDSKAFDS